jgi:hypothetical protein
VASSSTGNRSGLSPLGLIGMGVAAYASSRRRYDSSSARSLVTACSSRCQCIQVLPTLCFQFTGATPYPTSTRYLLMFDVIFVTCCFMFFVVCYCLLLPCVVDVNVWRSDASIRQHKRKVKGRSKGIRLGKKLPTKRDPVVTVIVVSILASLLYCFGLLAIGLSISVL